MYSWEFDEAIVVRVQVQQRALAGEHLSGQLEEAGAAIVEQLHVARVFGAAPAVRRRPGREQQRGRTGRRRERVAARDRRAGEGRRGFGGGRGAGGRTRRGARRAVRRVRRRGRLGFAAGFTRRRRVPRATPGFHALKQPHVAAIRWLTMEKNRTRCGLFF